MATRKSTTPKAPKAFLDATTLAQMAAIVEVPAKSFRRYVRSTGVKVSQGATLDAAARNAIWAHYKAPKATA